MNNTELLREARDITLKLHKALVDFEKESYVAFNGPVSPAQFLNQLLENPDLSWLRKFSTLIVDIDEMFAQRDGYSSEAVDIHIESLRRLVGMEGVDQQFRTRYELALQGDASAAALHADLRTIIAK